MVVVLPEPFGPSSPKTWPRGTSSERSSTATILPYRFVSDVVSMTKFPAIVSPFCQREHSRGVCGTLGVRVSWAAYAALAFL